jgi:NAD(P)-dependent dehydrogenase (short-subunit alcohol dehydrogenase family)
MVKKEKEELKPINELISLKGKRTLITGAGVGIGRAIARRFAEAGSALELVDIDEEALKEAQMELSQFKVDVNIHKVDLSVKEEIDALWERLRGKEPDILVNNAGVYPTKPFLEIDEPFFKESFGHQLECGFLDVPAYDKGSNQKGRWSNYQHRIH